MSLIVAAALNIKPRGMLMQRQAEKVDALKQALPTFAWHAAIGDAFPWPAAQQ